MILAVVKYLVDQRAYRKKLERKFIVVLYPNGGCLLQGAASRSQVAGTVT